MTGKEFSNFYKYFYCDEGENVPFDAVGAVLGEFGVDEVEGIFDDVQSTSEDLDAFSEFYFVPALVMKAFELRVVPEELWRVEDIREEADRVSV